MWTDEVRRTAELVIAIEPRLPEGAAKLQQLRQLAADAANRLEKLRRGGR